MVKQATKIAAALAVTAFALVALSGCTSYSRTEAYEVPYSVIEMEKPGWGGEFHYGYVNSEGQTQDLPVCERDGFFSQTVCSSEGGLVKFAFSRSDEGLTIRASVTVEGVKHSMKCSVNSEDTWSSLDVCIPEPVTE